MPVIGITASTLREAQPYAASLERRGATVRLLLPGQGASPGQVIREIDALMLSGGADIHPGRYQRAADAGAALEIEVDRDEMELPLLEAALRQDMPVLGICRGMQVLNVALGGKLIQDLPDHREVRENEQWVSAYHRIFVTPGSKLAAILGVGGFVRVNSRHHQGVKEAQKAASLLASAYSLDDGLIEALESPAHSWVLAVQCHPEREGELPPHWGHLFDGLVERASRSQEG
ncbi:MAG: gamma-glutamyl-gamma-aminobutyrate hydrolase family protein [Dehalococcoidia bacterium]|nr:gamma-glutamyl-gamma-aminobutyrate hydrolase family protein [Dehalococcoidia bacterium]